MKERMNERKKERKKEKKKKKKKKEKKQKKKPSASTQKEVCFLSATHQFNLEESTIHNISSLEYESSPGKGRRGRGGEREGG